MLFQKITILQVLDAKFINSIKANKLQKIVCEKILPLSIELDLERINSKPRTNYSLRSQAYYEFIEAETVNTFLAKHYPFRECQCSEGSIE